MAAIVSGVSYLQDGEEGWSRHILPALSILRHQESKSLPRSHLFPDLWEVSLDRAGSHGHVLWGWEIRARVHGSWLRLVFDKCQQALESPRGLKHRSSPAPEILIQSASVRTWGFYYLKFPSDTGTADLRKCPLACHQWLPSLVMH